MKRDQKVIRTSYDRPSGMTWLQCLNVTGLVMFFTGISWWPVAAVTVYMDYYAVWIWYYSFWGTVVFCLGLCLAMITLLMDMR